MLEASGYDPDSLNFILDRVATPPALLAVPGLKTAAQAKGMFFGTLIGTGVFDNGRVRYENLVDQQCDTIITNAPSWSYVETSQGSFDWGQMDAHNSWAVAHGKSVIGHTLCSWSTIPWWASVTAGNAVAYLNSWMSAVLVRYPNVTRWNVVNEAIDWWTANHYRDCPWLNALGTDYIKEAFIAARVYAPTAKLYYSDYGLELNGEESLGRRTMVLAIIDALQTAGAPIDGIAIQCHVPPNEGGVYDPTSFATFLSDIQSRGLEIIISEMDYMDGNVSANIPDANPDRPTWDATAAAMLGAIATTAMANTAFKGICVWGLSDTYSEWQSSNSNTRGDRQPHRGSPFNASLQTKAIYHALMTAFNGAVVR